MRPLPNVPSFYRVSLLFSLFNKSNTTCNITSLFVPLWQTFVVTCFVTSAKIVCSTTECQIIIVENTTGYDILSMCAQFCNIDVTYYIVINTNLA
nr:MAG TPA: XIAP-associated factor 1 [Caudoviricetes sp.]